MPFLLFIFEDDTACVNAFDYPVMLCDNGNPRIPSYDLFHARSYQRRFGHKERDSLSLHVRTHQRPVRVVVFKKWDQGSGNTYKLFWGNVH